MRSCRLWAILPIAMMTVILSFHVSPAGGTPASTSPTTLTRACDNYGEVTATVLKKRRKVVVTAQLSGAVPLEEYGFSLEWSGKGGKQPADYGAADGAGRAELNGDFDFSGFVVHGNRRVVYRLLAQSASNYCKFVGIVPRAKK